MQQPINAQLAPVPCTPAIPRPVRCLPGPTMIDGCTMWGDSKPLADEDAGGGMDGRCVRICVPSVSSRRCVLRRAWWRVRLQLLVLTCAGVLPLRLTCAVAGVRPGMRPFSTPGVGVSAVGQMRPMATPTGPRGVPAGSSGGAVGVPRPTVSGGGGVVGMPAGGSGLTPQQLQQQQLLAQQQRAAAEQRAAAAAASAAAAQNKSTSV